MVSTESRRFLAQVGAAVRADGSRRGKAGLSATDVRDAWRSGAGAHAWMEQAGRFFGVDFGGDAARMYSHATGGDSCGCYNDDPTVAGAYGLGSSCPDGGIVVAEPTTWTQMLVTGNCTATYGCESSDPECGCEWEPGYQRSQWGTDCHTLSRGEGLADGEMDSVVGVVGHLVLEDGQDRCTFTIYCASGQSFTTLPEGTCAGEGTGRAQTLTASRPSCDGSGMPDEWDFESSDDDWTSDEDDRPDEDSCGSAEVEGELLRAAWSALLLVKQNQDQVLLAIGDLVTDGILSEEEQQRMSLCYMRKLRSSVELRVAPGSYFMPASEWPGYTYRGRYPSMKQGVPTRGPLYLSCDPNSCLRRYVETELAYYRVQVAGTIVHEIGHACGYSHGQANEGDTFNLGRNLPDEVRAKFIARMEREIPVPVNYLECG